MFGYYNIPFLGRVPKGPVGDNGNHRLVSELVTEGLCMFKEKEGEDVPEAEPSGPTNHAFSTTSGDEKTEIKEEEVVDKKDRAT